MSSVVLSGDTSGTITVSAPAVAGSSVQTLAAVTGTLAPIVSGTVQATTSGTSFTFTGIPSWAKRVIVMLNGVSTNGVSMFLVQLGAGSIETSGYGGSAGSGTGGNANSAGFIVSANQAAAGVYSGVATILNVTGNTWVISGTTSGDGGYVTTVFSGNKTLSGALAQLRLTTVNGTDTFDAGSINILYE